MANTSKQRLGELTQALFRILLDHAEGMQAKEALAALAQKVELTEHERGFYAPGVRRFDKIVRFNTVGAVKAGWMTKIKGRWTITDAGRSALNSYGEPETFNNEMRQLYRRWLSSRPGSGEDAEIAEDEADTPSVTVTLELAEEQAWSEIRQHLGKMPPMEFQEVVASLLSAMNYHVAWIAPPGKDGGIDILAFRDPLGTQLPRIKVQVKRHMEHSVTVDGLRSFMALLGDNDLGLFVCTSGFTRDAHEEARTQEKRRITLLDLEKLFDLWVEHYDKLTEDARRRLPLKPIYFLAPKAL